MHHDVRAELVGQHLGDDHFFAAGRAQAVDQDVLHHALRGNSFVEAEATGERYYEAEIHRLRGELLLAASPQASTEAEACFRQALEVARSQEAKSLELRAANSLACLWRTQGKSAKARELLTEIYDWFTEGHDTLDLKKAKRTLDGLKTVTTA